MTVLEGADDDFGDEHRLGDDQRRSGRAQPHDRHEEEASGAGVPQQTRIDWFHVKHTLGSSGMFHVKHALGSDLVHEAGFSPYGRTQ